MQRGAKTRHVCHICAQATLSGGPTAAAIKEERKEGRKEGRKKERKLVICQACTLIKYDMNTAYSRIARQKTRKLIGKN